MEKNKKFALVNLIHASFATAVILTNLGLYIYFIVMTHGFSGLFGGTKFTVWEVISYSLDAYFKALWYMATLGIMFSVSTFCLSIIGIIKAKKLNYKTPYILFILSFFLSVIMYLFGAIFFYKNVKKEEKMSEIIQNSLNVG